MIGGGWRVCLLLGVSPRPGDTLDFGGVPAAILARSERSLLFVAS